MINTLLAAIVRLLLRLRYRIEIQGLDEIGRKGSSGILFLPNHPALIDPVILTSHLFARFKPRALANAGQVDRFLIRTLARRMAARTIPDVEASGQKAASEVGQALGEITAYLNEGGNMLLWPAGRVYRSRYECIGGNSAFERILAACPGIRVVLVRTTGLWGSGFSWAGGRRPSVAKTLLMGTAGLLTSGVIFLPKRHIEIEFHEPSDLSRQADRKTLNRYLEAFYNAKSTPNTHVPYSIWRGKTPLPRPEPGGFRISPAAPEAVNAEAQAMIFEHLSAVGGVKDIRRNHRLGSDLGIDSLAKVELAAWLQEQFGFDIDNAAYIETVADVLSASCGQFVCSGPATTAPPPRRWFKPFGNQRANIHTGQTIPQVFLARAARRPSAVVMADCHSGAFTCRDVVAACLLLKGAMGNLPGEAVAIMLPASSIFGIVYLAILFAGKVPVMINWTTGSRNVTEALRLSGAQRIITNHRFVKKMASQGFDTSAFDGNFVDFQWLVTSRGRLRRLSAKLLSYINWSSLKNAAVQPIAAVLFTSGSETLPKGVPLTHCNILSNLRSVLGVIPITCQDRLVGILPPFHSLGLTGTVLLPLCASVRAVYHNNPVEAGTVSQIIEAYRVTALITTPAFLDGIVRASQDRQLTTVRLIITGADKCPEELYRRIESYHPGAVVLEGYGVTECSPIISINRMEAPMPMTIGRLLPGYEHILLDPVTGRCVESPGSGELLVRGPSVFSGYLNGGGMSPFIVKKGKKWYRTGDMVTVDAKGIMTFRARLRRFVKIGGEMISLPAIESVLSERFAGDQAAGPALAVVATGQARPDLALFTTLPELNRDAANSCIRKAGLSALHNIRRVENVDEIPTLATGKVDYRSLGEQLA